MLIPAKALSYGGPRSRIQCQLSNGKILSAIAATPINSPNVAIGFDQNGQAWVWGESSKIQLQSISIRKNRPSIKEEIYPFKVVATWNTPLFIAQAGDRPSTQLSALKVLAFGNRGKNKNDFILLAETAINQYRLTTKEGERQLQFESPDFLASFKTKGKYYGGDFFGILLDEQQDWKFSDIITTINGNTTIKATPNGGLYEISTETITGSTEYDPPASSLLSPPNLTDFNGNPLPSRLGYKLTLLTLYSLPDPFYISGIAGDSIATPEQRAAWEQSIQACANGVSVETPPPQPAIGGGQTNRLYTDLLEKNINNRKYLLSGFLDSISKNTAIENSENREDYSDSGEYEVTPIVTLKEEIKSGGVCTAFVAFIPVIGAYYEFIRPYYDVFDNTSENKLKIQDDTFTSAYANSIQIKINNFNSIDYTISQIKHITSTTTSTINSTDSNISTLFDVIETIETRQSATVINNKVTGLYKGNEEICLYAKTDNSTFIANGNKTSYRDNTLFDGVYAPKFFNFSGETETNENIEPKRIYLADKENTILLETNYFYLKASNIKSIINLSELIFPFSFTINSSDLVEKKGLFTLYFDYPVKYTYSYALTENLYTSITTITSVNVNVSKSHSDEYHLAPDFNYPIEVIIFDEENIYKLLGTINFTYNIIPKNYVVKNPFDVPYGSLNYSAASLASASVTILNYQLIKYHALKGIDTNTFGHIYSPNNCLGLFQKLLGDNFEQQSGVSRANLYRRKNNQIILAFSDNSNLTKRGERYADLYRLEENKFIREGEKKGSYYPVINSSSQNPPNSAFISYQD